MYKVIVSTRMRNREHDRTHNFVEVLDRLEVLKETRVRDLAGCPFAYVCRVVDHRRVPLALVFRVGLGWTIKTIVRVNVG